VFDAETNLGKMVLPEFKRLVALFPPRRTRFNTRSSYVEFMVGKVAF
jgi:hypothetical protein